AEHRTDSGIATATVVAGHKVGEHTGNMRGRHARTRRMAPTLPRQGRQDAAARSHHLNRGAPVAEAGQPVVTVAEAAAGEPDRRTAGYAVEIDDRTDRHQPGRVDVGRGLRDRI